MKIFACVHLQAGGELRGHCESYSLVARQLSNFNEKKLSTLWSNTAKTVINNNTACLRA